MKFVVLLRGVNVGGKSRVVMSELKLYLQKAGFEEVLTYINSGNIIVVTEEPDTLKISARIKQLIVEKFTLSSDVVVIEASKFIKIVQNAPKWWGSTEGWKHNALFVIPPTTPSEVVDAIGELKIGIEKVAAGEGLVYQSMSFEDFGKTTTGKLASNPVYKQVTIRNYNTTKKIAELLKMN